MDPQQIIAELKNKIGNQLYKIEQYRSALPFYTDAIELCPDTAAYYGNRSACHMKLNRFEDALEDARKSVQLDPKFEKGYVRILKCSIALGEIMTAENAAKRLQDLQANGTAINSELQSLEKLKQYENEAMKAYKKKRFRKVVHCMDRCLDEAPTCTRYQTSKGECLTFLGCYAEATEIANNILHINKNNADAIYVRGMCLFYKDNIDQALTHFQQVLRLAPEHQKAMEMYKRTKLLKQKKNDGNDAYKNGRFQDACKLYTEALKIDPLNKKTNAKLFFNRATALARLKKTREAVDDCTSALNLDNFYLKALLRRAKCYMDLGDYEEAVKDYKKACEMDKNREHERLLQEAKLALKKSKHKDYYQILGIDRNASEDEIKKAYRKRALLHHPDRHANASEAKKKEQEQKFKKLGEAYGVLSNPMKKVQYDSRKDFGGGGQDEQS